MGLNEAVIYKTVGRRVAADNFACGCEPLQVPPIKIIVLMECNPSGSRPNFFGRQHLTFDKGGKNVVLSEG